MHIPFQQFEPILLTQYGTVPSGGPAVRLRSGDSPCSRDCSPEFLADICAQEAVRIEFRVAPAHPSPGGRAERHHAGMGRPVGSTGLGILPAWPLQATAKVTAFSAARPAEQFGHRGICTPADQEWSDSTWLRTHAAAAI
jgi:hypothetical protein